MQAATHSQSTPSGRTEKNPRALPVRLFLVVVLFLLFSNSLHTPFILDDDYVITRNPTIHNLWDLKAVFTPPENGGTTQGRPLINLSLAINWAISGNNTVSYHIANLIVHMFNACFLLAIVRTTLRHGRRIPAYLKKSETHITLLGLTVALFWAAHPINAIVINYTIQRAESFMAFFYLATLAASARMLYKHQVGAYAAKAKTKWLLANYLGIWTLSLLGMASKEVMISAPLMVAVYDWAFVSGSIKHMLKKRLSFYLGLFATMALVVYFAFDSGTRDGTAGFTDKMSSFAYFQTQWVALVNYIKLVYWPDPLVFDYGTDLITDPWLIWPAGVVMAALFALVVGCFTKVINKPWIAFLGLAFFAILGPTSSIVPVVTQVIAEHRMYLPSAALLALGVMALAWLWESKVRSLLDARMGGVPGAVRKNFSVLVVALIACTLLYLTFQRNRIFANEGRMWSDIINKKPLNNRPYCDRGNWHQALRNFEQSFSDYARGIELKRDFFLNYSNRGDLLEKMGLPLLAIEDYGDGNERAEMYYPTYNNRGNLFVKLGRYEEAMADFNRGIELHPNAYTAYVNRANLFKILNQFERAYEDYQIAINLNPGDPLVFVFRANVLMAEKRWSAAVVDLTRALERNPGLIAALQKRAQCFRALGNNNQAVEDFTRALQIAPGNPELLLNRGILLEQGGFATLALEDYKNAFQASGGTHTAALINMGNVFQSMGNWQNAFATYAEAEKLVPGFFPLYLNRGNAYQQMGNAALALADYERAFAAAPASADVQLRLAWLLATAQEAELRNPARALELARAAHTNTEGTLYAQRALVAALAANGQTAQAASLAAEVVQQATAAEDTKLVGEMQAFL